MLDVRLFASLRDGREKRYEFEASRFACAREIIAHLGIPAGDVAILLINGRHTKPEAAVKDGDVVSLFPPTGGG